MFTGVPIDAQSVGVGCQYFRIIDIQLGIVVAGITEILGVGNILNMNVLGINNIKCQRIGCLGRCNKRNREINGSVGIAVQIDQDAVGITADNGGKGIIGRKICGGDNTGW